MKLAKYKRYLEIARFNELDGHWFRGSDGKLHHWTPYLEYWQGLPGSGVYMGIDRKQSFHLEGLPVPTGYDSSES